MNKNYLLGFFALATMLFTASCQEEELVDAMANTDVVSFNVTTEIVGTRAATGEGALATKLYYGVYEFVDVDKDGDLEWSLVPTISKTAEPVALPKEGTVVNIRLAKQKKYSVIFWAQSEAENALCTVDWESRELKINNATANQESYDAFWGYDEVELNGALKREKLLVRPFAQLNIGVSDEDYQAAIDASVELQNSAVTVKKVPTTMNLANGEVSGCTETSAVAYASAAIPTSDWTFPVAGNKYLALNYVLVGTEQSLIDVKLSYTDKENGSYSSTFTSVPVKRNYRTNIYGNLLTNDADYSVKIEAGLGDEDNNIQVWDGESMDAPAIDDENKTVTVGLPNQLAWLAAAVNGTLPSGNVTRAVVDKNNFKGYTIKLESDINLGNQPWTPIGTSTNLSAGDTFQGTFDGQGFTITGLNVEHQDVAGLFGYVYGATIKNVTIEGATIKGNHYAGGIVAWVLNNKGNIQIPMVIENCHVKNSTITSTPEEVNGEWDNGDKVGGIVGYACYWSADNGKNDGAVISGCSVENTTIKAYRDFAGIVGYALHATIQDCSVRDITLEQDLTHDYKAPNTPTTFGDIIGRNEGGNTINGMEYVADGVVRDENDNYYISNAEGLKWVAEQVNTMEYYVNQAANIFDGKTVYLANDINLGGAEWTPIGDYAFSRTSFNGTFDGQKHTISNFKVTEPVQWPEKVTEASYGFFGNVKGTIKNLTVEEATVNPEGGRYSAALVGRLHNGGAIENCHVVNSSVTINHWQVGGLVGQNNNGNIESCSVVGSTITGMAAVGAIVGMDMAAGEHTIENCRVANTTLVQNASFGESYDASYGLAVGLVNASGIILHLNNVEVENNTIKGIAANTLIGEAEDGAKILVNGYETVADGLGYNAAKKEYAISSANGLVALSTMTIKGSEKVVLAANIDLTGVEFTGLSAFNPENNNTFDGQNHTVSNWTYTGGASDMGFLKQWVGNIENVTFFNCSLKTAGRSAIVAGKAYSDIKNVHVVNCSIEDSYWACGLISGLYNSGNITNCSATNSSVKSNGGTAAIVGTLNETAGTRSFTNCKVEGCTINNTGVYGEVYSGAAIVGMINISNSTVKFADCEQVNNTFKGNHVYKAFHAPADEDITIVIE